jgi:hypothetical protein
VKAGSNVANFYDTSFGLNRLPYHLLAMCLYIFDCKTKMATTATPQSPPYKKSKFSTFLNALPLPNYAAFQSRFVFNTLKQRSPTTTMALPVTSSAWV